MRRWKMFLALVTWATLYTPPATAQTIVPAADRAGVINKAYYSAHWPAGKDWLVVSRQGVNVRLIVPAEPSNPSLVASITVQKPDFEVNDAKQLEEALKKHHELPPGMGKSYESFSVDTTREYPCVRYMRKATDAAAKQPTDDADPELELYGFACLHPSEAGTVVDAAFSARGQAADIPDDLKMRADGFFSGITLHNPYTRTQDLRSLAETGDADAQVHLSLRLKPAEAESISWLRKAAEAGHPEAQTLLGLAHLRGRGKLTKDPSVALEWLRRAAEAGYSRAQHFLGRELLKSTDPSEVKQGVDWLEESAQRGYVWGQLHLGMVLIEGMHDVEKNETAGAQWVGKAAAQGLAVAQQYYGFAWMQGRGVIKDRGRARFWWSLAAAQGQETASRALQALDKL